MNKLLSCLVLFFLVACISGTYNEETKTHFPDTVADQQNNTVESSTVESSVQGENNQRSSPFPHRVDVAYLKQALSTKRFEPLDLNNQYLTDFHHVKDGDVLEGVGVEHNIVLHHLKDPFVSETDFVARMQSWDLGPLYLVDRKKAQEYSKLTTALSAKEVEEIFHRYTYQEYRADSKNITTYSKQETVGSALRMRFETYETLSKRFTQWGRPVVVYAIPCAQNLVVYLRNPSDTTKYSGDFSDIERNRQNYLDSTFGQMSKEIQRVYSLCGVQSNVSFALRPREELVSKILNERAFLRLQWHYDLTVDQLRLTQKNLAFDFSFSNKDIRKKIENDERIELRVKLFDDEGDEISGSDLVINTFKGGDRNKYTSTISKAHEFKIEKGDNVSLMFIPELVKYSDGDEQYRYEMKPLRFEGVVVS
ncbi:hypothetical protein D6774_03030 [Candidatus Woesearchaeota archaeon]|nr:MAG: hypothetical protein D6774_03030 [Candidatus Woesearchaeota archaeon]